MFPSAWPLLVAPGANIGGLSISYPAILRKYIYAKQTDSTQMPAPVDRALELFRPLATDWLRNVPVDDIDPALLVKTVVDSGNVTEIIPPDLIPETIYVSVKGKLVGDTRSSYHFSE